jgi:hypothetical protein
VEIVLRHVRGEEHLLLRQRFRAATASILPFALTLFLYSPRYPVAATPHPQFIHSYNEDSTLSRRTIGMPETDELKDTTLLLASLWEAAQRLPEGSERQDVFRQIGSFHWRLAALITRAL